MPISDAGNAQSVACGDFLRTKWVQLDANLLEVSDKV
jgi:hypothetical protein